MSVPIEERCRAFIEGGGVRLAPRARASHRHRRCARRATTSRFVPSHLGGVAEVHLCGNHARRVDDGLPINLRADW